MYEENLACAYVRMPNVFSLASPSSMFQPENVFDVYLVLSYSSSSSFLLHPPLFPRYSLSSSLLRPFPLVLPQLQLFLLLLSLLLHSGLLSGPLDFMKTEPSAGEYLLLKEAFEALETMSGDQNASLRW